MEGNVKKWGVNLLRAVTHGRLLHMTEGLTWAHDTTLSWRPNVLKHKGHLRRYST